LAVKLECVGLMRLVGTDDFGFIVAGLKADIVFVFVFVFGLGALNAVVATLDVVFLAAAAVLVRAALPPVLAALFFVRPAMPVAGLRVAP
jgi:hypothetical protein